MGVAKENSEASAEAQERRMSSNGRIHPVVPELSTPSADSYEVKVGFPYTQAPGYNMNGNTFAVNSQPCAIPAQNPGVFIHPIRDTNGLQVGAWEATVFNCADSCVPNCCMSFMCPCVSVAQISARMGFHSYQKVLVLFGILYTILLFLELVEFRMFRESRKYDDGHNHREGENHENDDSTTQRMGWEVRSDIRTKRFIISLMNFILSFIMVTFLTNLRRRIRSVLSIPGNTLEDLLCSWFLPPLVIIQLATQTKSYTHGSCSFAEPPKLPGYTRAENLNQLSPSGPPNNSHFQTETV